MNEIESICIFGDSTAWGAWDRELGGWVNRLWLNKAKKEEKDFPFIYNCSISGGDTNSILGRFEVEGKAREADVLIFQSGANDSFRRGKGGENNIPLDVFERNIEEIIERARRITDNILFINSKNLDESRSCPVAWDDIYYTNEDIKKYSDVMKNVCERNNILFLDIFGVLDNEDLEDGVHPNEQGHEKIFIKVKEFLKEKSWI